MATIPAVQDYHDNMAAWLVALSDGRLAFAECQREGSDLWVHCRAAAMLGQLVAFRAAQAERCLYLDSASGEALDRLVMDRYGFNRQAASPSVGLLALRFRVAPLETQIVPAGTIAVSADGVRVRTVAAVVLAAGSTKWEAVTAHSVEAGAGNNIEAASAMRLEAPPFPEMEASSDPTNGGSAFVGAADAESDTALKARARRFWWTQQRGTLAALEIGALTVPGCAQATAVEVLGDDGLPHGIAFVYVSDEAGNSSPALIAAVQTALEGYRPAGVFVQVLGGSPEYVSVELHLTMLAGFDTSLTRDRVVSAIVAFATHLAPGQTLLLDDLRAVVLGVPGVVGSGSNVVDPVGDVAPSSSSGVLRIRSEDVTFS